MNWISRLLAIGENRYVHSTVGAVVASIVCCALCWLPLWANIMASAIVVGGLAVYKEYGMDAKVDLLDIVFTLLGGATVWLCLIVNMLIV